MKPVWPFCERDPSYPAKMDKYYKLWGIVNNINDLTKKITETYALKYVGPWEKRTRASGMYCEMGDLYVSGSEILEKDNFTLSLRSEETPYLDDQDKSYILFVVQAIQCYEKSIKVGSRCVEASRSKYKKDRLIKELVKKGWGVPADLNQAIDCYRRAAEKRDGNGLWKLAECYAKGLGVEQSTELAVQNYKQALEEGNEEASLSLGYLLHNQECFYLLCDLTKF